jgi:hypothetical protein
MAFLNGAKTNRRNDMSGDSRYAHWILGGVIALATVVAAAAIMSTGNEPDEPRMTATVPAPAPSPSTTGSDAPPSVPANR